MTGALREALAADRIGRVRYTTARFSGFKRPRTDVGVTHTDGIHYFDLFAHLFGRSATRVTAVQRDYLGRGLDDMSMTVVEYDDVTTFVEANYFVPGTWRECVIVGERGSLVADYVAASLTLHLSEHRRTATAWEAVDTGKESLEVRGDEPLSVRPAPAVSRARCRPSRGWRPWKSWRPPPAPPAWAVRSCSTRCAAGFDQLSVPPVTLRDEAWSRRRVASSRS